MAKQFTQFRRGCLKQLNICAVLWWTLVLATIASLIYLLSIVPRFQNVEAQDAYPADWLRIQENISLNGIFANFGSAGSKAYGASEGVLLDSSVPNAQDHLWTRVRDSHIVFKTLADRFVLAGDQKLQLAITRFITAQAAIQRVESPAGTLTDGSGLSEPRFLPNITPDPSNAGRPKRDGPALRAITLMTYGRWLLDSNYEQTARDVIWPIVRNDLNYVAQYWHKASIDFWSSPRKTYLVDAFFIRAVQHRALVAGAAFARKVGEQCGVCEGQGPQVLCSMQGFRKVGEQKGIIVADLVNGTVGDRSGYDASTLFASIFNFDPEVGCDDRTFQPCSEVMLRNHKEVVDQFRSWVINAGIEAGRPVAIGRFPEDDKDPQYNDGDHGNPWYVCTLAAAEQLYDSLFAYEKFGSITVTNTSLPFWQAIYPSAEPGLWVKDSTAQESSNTYKGMYNAMRSYADGFIDIVRNSIPEDGSLYEQFSMLDGKPLGAKDLSWSYGAFLSMKDRREGNMPASWGALDASKSMPSECNITKVEGTYDAVDNIQWPQFPCTPVKTVQVTFNIFGQNVTKGRKVYVYGSAPELGAWDKKKALLMDGFRYNQGGELPLWSVSVQVPAGTRLEYKYRAEQEGMESTDFQYQVERETCWDAAATSDTW